MWALLMWQGGSFFCSVWTWSALFKSEFPRAGCILIVWHGCKNMLSLSKPFFLSVLSQVLWWMTPVWSSLCLRTGLCSLQREMRQEGAGKKIRKGDWGVKIQIICKKPCDLIALESLACAVWVLEEMGELLKGLQRAQHSEAALWGLGEKTYQVKPIPFAFCFIAEF